MVAWRKGMIFVIAAVLILIQVSFTVALAVGLRHLVPEFHVIVRYGIAFAVVFMVLSMIVRNLCWGDRSIIQIRTVPNPCVFCGLLWLILSRDSSGNFAGGGGGWRAGFGGGGVPGGKAARERDEGWEAVSRH